MPCGLGRICQRKGEGGKKSKYSVSTKALGMKIQDIYQNTVGEDRVMIILYFTDSRKHFLIFF